MRVGDALTWTRWWFLPHFSYRALRTRTRMPVVRPFASAYPTDSAPVRQPFRREGGVSLAAPAAAERRAGDLQRRRDLVRPQGSARMAHLIKVDERDQGRARLELAPPAAPPPSTGRKAKYFQADPSCAAGSSGGPSSQRLAGRMPRVRHHECAQPKLARALCFTCSYNQGSENGNRPWSSRVRSHKRAGESDEI
jgi:hypothetical protein